MRKLTFYELQILIINEIKTLDKSIVIDGFNVPLIYETCKDILAYIKEMEELEVNEGKK